MELWNIFVNLENQGICANFENVMLCIMIWLHFMLFDSYKLCGMLVIGSITCEQKSEHETLENVENGEILSIRENDLIN